MKRNKSYYTALNFEGYTWSGFWDKYHHFVKREINGYLEVRCTDTDIEDGNLLDMMKLGFTK